jgi:soluble lytic murein transglycosylase-like protein
MRYVVLAAIVGLLVVSPVVFVAQAATGETDEEIRTSPDTAEEVNTDQLLDSYLKVNVAQEQAYLATVQEKEMERRRQEAIASYGQWGPELVEAAAVYGQNAAELYRVMQCESKGDPYADNGVNKGLFQFHPGTFAGTPYGDASIYDGPSQIFAAAWMWSQGRQGEWGCY